ncbi:MAG: TIGR03985 family CRISPR-associated protein [Synechococcus sp.]|nr:TIGR03985 family CRISPR-associated protein [Synechococcus sp.]
MLDVEILAKPTPEVFNWLSGGQWSNRFLRTFRLWFLVSRFCLPEFDWLGSLPRSFSYPQLRDRLFAPTHNPQENATVDILSGACANSDCICQQTLQELIGPFLTPTQGQWLEKVQGLTGFTATQLVNFLDSQPFLTVHRSLRNDLQLLVDLGWLEKGTGGNFRGKSTSALPVPPDNLALGLAEVPLEAAQQRDLLHVLQAIAFVQPNLEVIVEHLWQQVHQTQRPFSQQKRLFIHLDYILSDDLQEQVDEYQLTLEELWATPEGGVIQFDNWLAQEERKVQVTVYPVCLHYARRAKYLSAYGLGPSGRLEWHNYRLDRIASPHLKVLPWGSAAVPSALRHLRNTGQLPTSAEIEKALQEAWGFNFYLPKVFLILRFPATFAHWYVERSVRHETFRRLDYEAIPRYLQETITNPQEREKILRVLAQRSPEDLYYGVWVRWQDINVLMRLRDWRPNGEVIAPLIVRQKMRQEVLAEWQFYQLNA